MGTKRNWMRGVGVMLASAMMVGITGCENEPELYGTEEGRGEIGTQSSMTKLSGLTFEPEARPQPAPAARPAPPPASDNCMSFPTTDPRSSVIQVCKSCPGQVTVGNEFSYELTVRNLTNYTVADVVLTETVPGNFRWGGSTPATSPSGGNAQWNLGTFGPSEVKTVTVRGTPSGSGTITTCADVTYRLPICCDIEVVQPALTCELEGPTNVLLCDEIPYVVTVCNTGTGPANDAKVMVNLPNGVQTIDGQQSVTINVGTLAAGDCKKYTVRTKAQRTGSFANTANATAAGNLRAASGTVNTVVTQPVLAIDCSSPTAQFIGRPVRYTFTARNSGNAASENTILEANMTGGGTIETVADGGVAQGNRITWNLGTLAAGASRTVNVVVRPNGRGNVAMTANVRGDCADMVSCNTQTDIRGIPAVLLEVIDIDDPVEVGTNTTYVISVTNQGSADAINVVVVAETEDEFEFVSGTGTTGVSNRGNSITMAPVATLAPGAKAEWRIVVRALPGGDGDHRFRVRMDEDQLGRPVEETEATRVYSFE